MSNQHSIGPWKIDNGETLKVRNNTGTIAMLFQVHLNGRRDPKEVSANAKLIAAAPELLATLTECRDACLVGDDDGITVSEDVTISSDMFDRICDAINKATKS